MYLCTTKLNNSKKAFFKNNIYYNKMKNNINIQVVPQQQPDQDPDKEWANYVFI